MFFLGAGVLAPFQPKRTTRLFKAGHWPRGTSMERPRLKCRGLALTVATMRRANCNRMRILNGFALPAQCRSSLKTSPTEVLDGTTESMVKAILIIRLNDLDSLTRGG
jgi:hypothetical protein